MHAGLQNDLSLTETRATEKNGATAWSISCWNDGAAVDSTCIALAGGHHKTISCARVPARVAECPFENVYKGSFGFTIFVPAVSTSRLHSQAWRDSSMLVMNCCNVKRIFHLTSRCSCFYEFAYFPLATSHRIVHTTMQLL